MYIYMKATSRTGRIAVVYIYVYIGEGAEARPIIWNEVRAN